MDKDYDLSNDIKDFLRNKVKEKYLVNMIEDYYKVFSIKEDMELLIEENNKIRKQIDLFDYVGNLTYNLSCSYWNNEIKIEDLDYYKNILIYKIKSRYL